MAVQELLAPYLSYIEPIHESKLYTKQMTQMVTVLPKIVINHPKGVHRFLKIMKALKVDIGEKIKQAV